MHVKYMREMREISINNQCDTFENHRRQLPYVRRSSASITTPNVLTRLSKQIDKKSLRHWEYSLTKVFKEHFACIDEFVS